MSYNKVGALRFVEENDVRFIRLQFCDLLGNLKNISISPSQLNKAFDEGIAFDGSSIQGFSSIEDSELFLYPDPTTLCILPWRPQQGKVARLFCNIKKADGSPFEGDCRYILKTIFEKVKCCTNPSKKVVLLADENVSLDSFARASLQDKTIVIYFNPKLFDTFKNLKLMFDLAEQFIWHEATHLARMDILGTDEAHNDDISDNAYLIYLIALYFSI